MSETDNEEYVSIRRSEMLVVLRHLNTLVVSMARIGSCCEEDIDGLLLQFCKDWDLCRRLAECRKILSEPFSRELGHDDMDELERELQDIEVWRFDKRKP